jgi:hypothetical protein
MQLELYGRMLLRAPDVAALAAAPALQRLAVLHLCQQDADGYTCDELWRRFNTPLMRAHDAEALDLSAMTALTHLTLAAMSEQHRLPPGLREVHLVEPCHLSPSLLELPSRQLLVVRDAHSLPLSCLEQLSGLSCLREVHFEFDSAGGNDFWGGLVAAALAALPRGIRGTQ